MNTQQSNPIPQSPLRGVNLGNWLLLERWMRPRLFEGTTAKDEYTLSLELGDRAQGYLLRHRDEFIGEADFAWLRDHGINAVRVPFGYWILEPDGPYVASPQHLDKAVALAEQYGLQVVLDLHGLPGAQGPNDHTGRSGFFRWHTERQYIDRSLDLIEQIAQRYAASPSVTAFSVINEPEPTIGREILVPFYDEARERVRRHMPAERVAFVLSAFPECELPTYHNCITDDGNTWTDVHLYQCFGDSWDSELLTHLQYPLERQLRLRKHLASGPVIVGEWSLGVAKAVMKQLQALPPERQQLAMRTLGHTHLMAMEEYAGWFFWSYRVDDRPMWSYRDAVELGWLPDMATLPPQPL